MIAILSAPSNLGLRPPAPGRIPGTNKAPEALHEAGLFARLVRDGARDAGVIASGPYVDDDHTRLPGHVRNETALIEHAHQLADRLVTILDASDAPLVLGGDCSILLGIGLALSKRGRVGLVHVDGHTDFRHPGNSEECASVAGEDLAAAVGLHWPVLSNMNNAGPYFAPQRVVHIGHRDNDEEAAEAAHILGLVVPASEAINLRPVELAAQVRTVAGAGYWLQIDVDVLDPSVMPAVDSPDPGGLDAKQLTALLEQLAPAAIGASVTVFDPELDPDGRYARLIADVIVVGLSRLGAAR